TVLEETEYLTGTSMS
nr:immunoglobulin heavy chain junction region [Mus musculus]